jgi:hypothetical protein
MVWRLERPRDRPGFIHEPGRQAGAGLADYWQQLRSLIDLAYDRYGLRTQITIFADAQLMPGKGARMEHLRRLLAQVLPRREHKIMLLEVANEAWQNGFPGTRASPTAGVHEVPGGTNPDPRRDHVEPRGLVP